MEVIKHVFDLIDIFLLHFSSWYTFFAYRIWIREQYLVNHNVSYVDILLSKLDWKSLSFVHTKELWDTDGNESCSLWILELHVDLFCFLFHSIHSIEKFFMNDIWIDLLSTFLIHHWAHGSEHSSEFFFHFNKLHNSFFKNSREVKKSQSMTSWSSIKNDQIKIVLIKTLKHLSKRCSLINTRDGVFDLWK